MSVLVVVATVAVIGAVAPAPTAARAPGAEDAVPVAPSGALSSSAFCAAGTGTAAATTIYLTNSTPRPVRGVMTTIGNGAAGHPVPTERRPVTVPPLGTTALNPALGLPAGSNASSFVFAGGGVVASQVVSGPGGWSTAPCASQVSSRWILAGGSTAAGDTLTLSLFDPGASEAVVNVSFLTPSGMVSPQAYQGLVVPPGRQVIENVGDFVQGQADIATLVTAQSGALVSDQLQQWSSGRGGGLSLRLGAPRPSRSWRFAQTTVIPGSTVSFYLANPGTGTAAVTVSAGLGSAAVIPKRVTVPPLSMAVFAPSSISGWPKGVPYAVDVISSVPIVAARSVQVPAGRTPPVRGSSSGSTTIATRWLVPGPGVVRAPGTANATVVSLAIADPGPSPARVVVTELGQAPPLATFTVAPRQLTVLGAHRVGGLRTFVVTSSQPVDVEVDSRPSGGPGVVSSTGFPLSD